ncbi:MAG: hypothetical protein II816_01610, partial [Elusimicrobia bacterium]|nr:hypothetical protein [Elusimicrobiota bacterium]
MTLYQSELQSFADKFSAILKNSGIEASIDGKSFRDYFVQIKVKYNSEDVGFAGLYYKPSKKTYSLATNGIKDEKVLDIINKCWDKANGFETFDEASGVYEAFVDGSFINGKTGYGAVIFLGDKKIQEFSGSLEDTSTRQFGGEIFSVMQVLKWCEENNVTKIRINYDYLGIEYFATGKWAPKNTLAIEYADVIAETKVEILWRKIDSHTGNKK